METEISEISDLESCPYLGKDEETDLGKNDKSVDVQIFKIEELRNCLEYIKQTCVLPVMKKVDFDTINKIMICYITIVVSFET